MTIVDSYTRQVPRNKFVPANENDQLPIHYERAAINLEDYMQLREEQEVEAEGWRLEFETDLPKDKK